MDNATHFAALKAAAKVAFGITVLAGCTAETATPDDGTQTASSESDYKKKAKTPAPEPTCHHDAGQPQPKPTCDQVLASAFPDPSAFTWNWQKDAGAPQASDDVKSCCEEDLTKNHGASQYRWACCDALDNGAGTNQNVGIACTPWGPPVPPRMRRRNVALEGIV